MENQFPTFRVIDEWTVAHGCVAVQLVEVAFNHRHQLDGSDRGVRIILSDTSGDERASLVFCMEAAMEIASGLENALKRDEAWSVGN